MHLDPTKTWDDKIVKIYAEACEVKSIIHSLRLGQSVYNIANKEFPREVEKLTGTEKDCFYQDENITPFLTELQELIDAKSTMKK